MMLTEKNIKNKLTLWLASSILLSFLCLESRAQTLVGATVTGTPVAGDYYNYSSITLMPVMEFTPSAGQSLHYYIAQEGCSILNTLPSKSQNYVMTSSPRVKGIKLNADLGGKSICDLMQTIQYIDGLGRPIQTVQVKASPTGKDVVQPVAYDLYGRETVKYLPYTVSSAAGGAFQLTALVGNSGYSNSQQYLFYQQSGQGYVNTQYPKAVTGLEASPLNRPLEQGAPGADWQIGSHTVKMAYTLNNNLAWAADSINSRKVALYYSTIASNQNRTLTSNGYYSDGQLSVTTTKDENWVSGRAGTVEEYKDKEGRVVLKRVYNYTTVLQQLSTYYVYDDMGQLAFVLPPMANADGAGAISSTTLNNFSYQYRYDERGRLSQKKLPGKGWEYMVYNKLDQIAATQDSLQRAAGRWLYSKYDALGRSISGGIWTAAFSRANLQDTLNNQMTFWEKFTAGTGYSNAAWPKTLTTALNTSYYDSYTGIPSLPSAYTATATPTIGASKMTRGLPTASQIAVLNTPADKLWSVSYYDEDGQNIKTYKQHYLGGTVNMNNYDAVSTTYDFTNAATTATRQHFTTASTSSPQVTIADEYIYDHMGRKLKTWEKISNSAAAGTRTLLSKVDYNEIGQLWNKHLHSTDSTAFAQDIAYSYNERGWMLNSNAALFQQQLQYNTGTNKQYNGNIAYQLWGTTAAPNTNTYTYTYDKLNRLLGASSNDNNNETGLTYDLHGNITALNRYQVGTLTDQLIYNYSNNTTNQLQSISDASGSNTGIKTGTSNYTYDGNGNAKTDQTRSTGNIAIAYNLLNLPQAITGAKTITYTYDASGTKLRRVSPGIGTSDYVSGIQYEAGTIRIIQTEEGKAVANGTGYIYNYYLADHLGNTRVVFAMSTATPTVVQKDDYYAFGQEINQSITSPKNLYLYNKKELQEELGQYDYGARFYDPVIARWTTIDPKADKYDDLTPYNYVANNPLKYTDPDGRIIVDKNGKIVFAPLGTTVVKHPSGSSAKVMVGYIFANDGTRIMAFKNMSGKKGWDTDCHGQTFTNGEYWINNDDVRNLLKGDNYKKENEQDSKTGDKVVYTDQDGEVQDSRTITRTNAPDGTCVYGQGGLEENNYESQIDQTWTAPGTKKEIYRKTDPNKKATKDEINKLIATALDDLKKQQEKEQKKDNNKQ